MVMTEYDLENDTKWSKYKHPSVKDLAWILYSVPLFSKKIEDFSAFEVNVDAILTDKWLSTIEHSMHRYPKLQRENFSRLGLYCEALLEFCFTVGWDAGAVPFRLIKRSLQIKGQLNTLGECDFILEDRAKNVIHLELAVKFYLQHMPQVPRWDNWIGPNTTDRLDLKMQRMFSHQLSLLSKEENYPFVTTEIKKLGISKTIESQHLIKGRLFFHFGTIKNNTLPESANEHLHRGYWLHNNDFKKYCEESKIETVICEKLDWLTGPIKREIQGKNGDAVLHIKNMYQNARDNKRNIPPIYLLISDSEKKMQDCPFIVVPDYWPETNSPSRMI